jgi:hypothetical protein
VCVNESRIRVTLKQQRDPDSNTRPLTCGLSRHVRGIVVCVNESRIREPEATTGPRQQYATFDLRLEQEYVKVVVVASWPILRPI